MVYCETDGESYTRTMGGRVCRHPKRFSPHLVPRGDDDDEDYDYEDDLEDEEEDPEEEDDVVVDVKVTVDEEEETDDENEDEETDDDDFPTTTRLEICEEDKDNKPDLIGVNAGWCLPIRGIFKQ